MFSCHWDLKKITALTMDSFYWDVNETMALAFFLPLGCKINNCVGRGFVPSGNELNTGFVPLGDDCNTGFIHDNLQTYESNQFTSTRHTYTKLWQGLSRLLYRQTQYKGVVLQTVPYLMLIQKNTGWLLNYSMMTSSPVWTKPTRDFMRT